MISFKVTGVNIQADVNNEDLTSVTLHALVTSDRITGSAAELEQIARAVGVLCNTDLDDAPRPEDARTKEVNSTISYEESNVYDRVRNILERQSLRGIYPIEAIKTLEGPESEGMLLAVRDWLNEVTQ